MYTRAHDDIILMPSSFTLDVCVCTVCSPSLIGLGSWHVCTDNLYTWWIDFIGTCEVLVSSANETEAVSAQS